MKIVKTVLTAAPVSAVFTFLADFTTTEQWDPGTVRTRRIAGDGGVGTRYANTSRFLGRTTELAYEVTHRRVDELIALRGENTTLVAHDRMSFSATPDGGTTVRYEADFELKGWVRFIAPLLRPAFIKLGNDGADRLQTVVDRLRP